MMNMKLVAVNAGGVTEDAPFDLSTYEQAGFEVYCINETISENFQPHDIMRLIDGKWNGQELADSRLFLVTNSQQLLALMYRLYHQTFACFVYTASHKSIELVLDSVYRRILDARIDPREQLRKTIYIQGGMEQRLFTSNIETLSDVQQLLEAQPEQPRLLKYYLIDGKYYVFEAFRGDTVVISIDPTDAPRELSYFNTVFPSVRLNLDLACETLQKLNNEQAAEIFIREHLTIQHVFTQLADCIHRSVHHTKETYLVAMLLLSNSFNKYVQIFVLSFLADVTSQPVYLTVLLEIAISADELTREQKFFLLYQCNRYLFLHNSLANRENSRLVRKLYRQIYTEYQKDLQDYQFISREDRDSNLVIVITSQILSLNHAPTKTALDRCYHLMKLGKRVLLINTKDVLSVKEVAPFYNVSIPNHIQQLENEYKLSYKDLEIGFYQTGFDMPDILEIRNIIGMIAKHKPYFVVGIGSLNLTADLCSNLVPTVTVPLGFSSLPITESQFHVASTNSSALDWELLGEFGFNEDNVVHSVFTFDFKPQQNTYTRELLGLPKDKFLLAVVGGRLNQEISDAFLETLLSTVEAGTHIVFVGPFTAYESFTKRHPELETHSTTLGLQDDVLAVLEVCDLYVNPERLGGGSSVAEAMYKSLPAVTLNLGDVAVNTGPEFWVDTYVDMRASIQRYVMDRQFYEVMSAKARERAAVLMNTRDELARMIGDIEGRTLFE